ncbi:MAG TPA: T9SS type B sorting domain-containing protein, partial [Flavobacteriales bacterium]|nr:T9SS type B sorting domain-containing protein [Flavobacteriales bacterium]
VGGASPYQYLWNTVPQQTDTLANGLLAGFYTVIVTDINGCTASDSVNISDTSNMSASITSLTLSSCGGACDGSAIVTPSGSTMPYIYNWVDSLGVSIGETDSLADSLCAGLYRVIVTSNSFCMRSVPANTTTPLPEVSFSGLTSPHCSGDTLEALIGIPTGGTFSGAGINGNFFDPALAGIGIHLIKYVYTDGNNCTDSSIQTVEVNGIDFVDFAGLDTGYCVDAAPVVLSGFPPGGDFSGNGISGAVFDPANAGPGTHSITYEYTSFEGCSDTSTKKVNVNPLPTLSISGLSASYCIDVPEAPLTGTPSGGVFSGIGISGNTFYPSIADTGSHIITYTYTAGTGCTNNISQAVTVTPMPIVSYTGLSPSLCVSAANNTLTGSPLGGTFSGNGISGNIFSPSAAGVGTHTIKYFYSDGNGCTDSSGQSVVVMALPAVTFFGLDPEYCVDALTVSLVGFPLGGTFSGPGISGSLFDPGSAGIGTHSVTYSYTDGNGCADSVAQNVIVNALPVPVITPDGDTTFCQGDSVVLNTIVATSYLWSTGDTTSSLTVKSSGSYSVYITDVNACFAMSPSIIVTVNNLPTIVTSSIDVSCNGGSDGIAIGMAFGGVAPYSYQWDSPPVQTNDTATALSAGSYTLVVTDSNGCVDSVAVQVFEPLALSTSTYSSVVSCNGDSDGTASIVVMGGIPSYSYLWDDGNAQTNFTAIGLSSGNYNVTATDANGCIITDSIAVIEPAVLSLSVLETAVSCFNAGDGTAVVTVSGGNPSYTYLWSDGQTSSMAIGLSGGIYTVEVVDFKGCDDEIEATVSEMTELTATTTTIETTLGNSDGQGTVNAFGGAPPYSYEWSDGQIDSVATGLGQGSYNITVTDNDGCTTSEMIEIEVATLDVSTGFTPNGDGTNDLWSIGDMSLYPFVEVTVMNRWGEQIFYSEGYNEPWDGTYKGEVLPMGSYFFIIDLNEGTDPTTGAVTILK